MAIVDVPPEVTATTPANGATGVAVDANIDITFSEDVTVSGAWFSINCGSTGVHTAVSIGWTTDRSAWTPMWISPSVKPVSWMSLPRRSPTRMAAPITWRPTTIQF